MLFRKKQKYLPINTTIKRKKMDYYWRKFTELVEISYHYDKNSQEYSKINKAAWVCFDRWSELFLIGYIGMEFGGKE